VETAQVRTSHQPGTTTKCGDGYHLAPLVVGHAGAGFNEGSRLRMPGEVRTPGCDAAPSASHRQGDEAPIFQPHQMESVLLKSVDTVWQKVIDAAGPHKGRRWWYDPPVCEECRAYPQAGCKQPNGGQREEPHSPLRMAGKSNNAHRRMSPLHIGIIVRRQQTSGAT